MSTEPVYCIFTTTPLPDGRFKQCCAGGCFKTLSPKYWRVCDCTNTVKPGECKHLGAKLRTEPCETCRGLTKIKVFACAVHGECTWQTKVGEVPVCHGCPDVVKGDPAS